MSCLKLRLELLDYWHAGSGVGRGWSADALVVRDRSGLPYLPGRTLRGLLRDALSIAEQSALQSVPPGSVQALFGSRVDPARSSPDSYGISTQGKVEHVSDATLPQEIVAWAAQTSGLAEALFETVASTAIDDDGVAREHSLRAVEVAVPLTLHASIHAIGPDLDWGPLLASLPFVRGLGTSRRRGMGRVQLSGEVA